MDSYAFLKSYFFQYGACYKGKNLPKELTKGIQSVWHQDLR